MKLSDLKKKMASLTKRQEAIKKAGDTGGGGNPNRNPNTPEPKQVFGAPHVRKGENPLTSRGFSFLKLAKAMVDGNGGGLGEAWENAKVERDVALLLKSNFGAGVGSTAFENHSVLAPFSADLFPDELAQAPDFGVKLKSLMYAGVENADLDEMKSIVAKSYVPAGRKDMSWLDQLTGGSLVGPPAFGDLIDLFRNQAALTQAGVQVIGLPPTGRITFPRQTSASTGYYVGENTAPTATSIGTGQLTLSAKKAAALLGFPNELLRYASVSAEALFRLDLTRTLSLLADKYGLEGQGSDVSPRGLINTPGIATVTPTTVATDGNTLAEGDVYSFMAALEENNAQFEKFIMRPTMYYALLKRRNDAVSAADKKGAFTFSPFRQLGDNVSNKNINGFQVVTSNQVSNTRTKGSGTNLSYILGGMFSDVLFAMFGAIEFAVATQGDTAFAKDQTVIRAILIHDIGARHPGAIALCDQLLVQ